MPPLLLAIDTAFERCSAAILDQEDGAVRALAEPEIGKGHAERLMGVIDAVLAEAGASYADLGRIAVSVGPGSFTGLRVGVSAARALALALGVPAIGVTTLEALAAPHLGAGAPVLSVIDAKRGEVDAALFAADGRRLGGPEAMPPADLSDFLTAGSLEGLRLVGSGAGIAADSLRLGPESIAAASNALSVSALGRLALHRAPDGAPRPLYLRGADAKPPAPTRLFDERAP